MPGTAGQTASHTQEGAVGPGCSENPSTPSPANGSGCSVENDTS